MISRTHPYRARLRLVFRVVFPVLLIVYIIGIAVQNRETIHLNITRDSIVWGGLSFCFFFLGVATVALNWKTLLEILGVRCGMFDCLRTFYYSMLFKYIPGKIWGVTGRIVLARRHGIPEGTNALSIVLESVFLMTSASLVGLLVLGRLLLMPVEIRVLLLASPLVLVFLHPRMIHRGVTFLAQRFPVYVMDPDEIPGWRILSVLLARYCLVWIFQGLGFWCALKMIHGVPDEYLLTGIGGNSLAWLSGYLAVFTPAGLGVREYVLARVTSGIIPAGPAAMAAIVSRLIVILCEVMASLALYLFLLIRNRRNRSFGQTETR